MKDRPTRISGGKLLAMKQHYGKLAWRKWMYNIIVFVNANQLFTALRSNKLSIGSVQVCYSFGISFSSTRQIPVALSTVSSDGCILISSVPKVACTLFAVVVSSCFCNICGCFFVCSSISTVFDRSFSLFSSLLGLFYYIGSFLLNLGCWRKSVRCLSCLVSMSLIVFLHFWSGLSLSLYRIDNLLLRFSTLVLSTASILIVKSNSERLIIIR